CGRCLSFFFQAEDGIRDFHVTGVQTCALPISERLHRRTQRPQRVRQLLRDITGLQGVEVGLDAAHPLLVVPHQRERDGDGASLRSEERRGGKGWSSRRAAYPVVN